MACADGNAVAREDLTDVVRVNTVHRKGDDAAMLLGLFRAQHVDVRHLADRVHRAACQRDLLLMHRCKADALDIVNGRVQTHGVCRVDRAGLELVRELGEDRTIAGDRFNHLAAGEERRHGVQQFFTSVENADAHGAVDLVAGEGEEIRVQRLHVHRNVRRALRAVDDQHRAGAVHQRRELADGIYAA